MNWPQLNARQASFIIATALCATSGLNEFWMSNKAICARMNKTSPTFTACGIPHFFQTVGRPRRRSELSWMSSWTSEKLWMSSIQAAAGKAISHSLKSVFTFPDLLLDAEKVKRTNKGRIRFPAATTPLPTPVQPIWYASISWNWWVCGSSNWETILFSSFSIAGTISLFKFSRLIFWPHSNF